MTVWSFSFKRLMLKLKVRNRNKFFFCEKHRYLSAARSEEKTADHKKNHRKPDWARSRWKRESLLPYRLVSQPGKQANSSACWFSFRLFPSWHLPASTLARHGRSQDPGWLPLLGVRRSTELTWYPWCAAWVSVVVSFAHSLRQCSLIIVGYPCARAVW